jgi:hypothetical protein
MKIFAFFLAIPLFYLSFAQSDDRKHSPLGDRACWVHRVGRGLGRPPSACPRNLEKSGLLCYPACPSGKCPKTN